MQQAILEEDFNNEVHDNADNQYDIPIVTNLILTIGYTIISIRFLYIEIK